MKKTTIFIVATVAAFLSSAQGSGAQDLQLKTFRISNMLSPTSSNWDITVTDTGGLLLRKEGQTASYVLGGSGSLSITKPGAFGGTQTILIVDNYGNMTTGGVINGSSDVHRKENIGTINPSEILEKLVAIPLKTWSYKGESIAHIGPMAQDFHQAFKLGESERTISTVDADGVALASIQALHTKLIEKDRQISDLEVANADIKMANSKLEERLQRLEKLIESKK